MVWSWRRWFLLALGLVAILVGGVLLFRPYASFAVLLLLVVVGLVVMGIGMLVSAERPRRPLNVAIAVGMFAAALLLVVWPGAGIRTLAVLIGLWMAVEGVIRAAGGIRGSRDERLSAVLMGIALLILGVLALAWPDVTVIVVGVVFGIRVLWFGLVEVWAAIWGRRTTSKSVPSPAARWAHVLVASAALAVALLLLAASVALHRGEPRPDAFYAPPSNVPSAPGQLLRADPFDRDLPQRARAWRILYTTTRDERQPGVASAIVLAPAEPPVGPRPVVAWAHGTTGAVPGCAPSVVKHGFAAGMAPALQQVVDNGWVMVASDYIGLGTAGPHPYLIGQGEARSVLDAVRAAHQLDAVDLADQTVVWGHSQGGHAALWTGILAPIYAPDAHVVGIAALAPASNLPGLVQNLDVVPGGSIFGSYVISAYSETYPDVKFDEVVRPIAQIQLREMASRCLAEPEVFVSVGSSLLFSQTVFAGDPIGGAFGKRLIENIPTGPISAPLLIGQGEADALVLPSAQKAFVDQRCATGGQVDYRTYPGRDHTQVVEDDSPLIPQLLTWTKDRFDGRPTHSTCS